MLVRTMTYRSLSAVLLTTAFAIPAFAQITPAEVSPAPSQEVALPSMHSAAPSARAALPAIMATQPDLIADLAAAVSPAVVNIRVTTPQGEVVSEGHGSGFIISSKGEVVTNYHVIDEGEIIEIEFNTGISFPADIVGVDPETDLALLQIDSQQTFPVVEWHDNSPLRIGEFVVPIGNPFGIGQSVSFGIISAIGRDRVDSGAYVDYIQTDATVNTGNSGGPLFDLQGKVVAVNSAIYSPTGASVGIAFAIPHHTAENVIERLRRDGEVERGYLGVGLRTGEYNTGRSGAIIDSLVPGGPAQMAGLRIEDIILSVNGTPVQNSIEATRLIGDLAPDDQASFRIERNEREANVTATLTRRPSKENLERAAAGLPSISDATPTPYAQAPSRRGTPRSEGRAHHIGMANTGLSLVDLSAQFRSAIGMSYDQVGVYVETVLPNTGAEARGMSTGMVLMELETEPVASVDIFRELVAKHRNLGKSEALLKVRLKNGSETYVSLPIV